MGERDQDTLIQAAQEDALSTDNAGGFGEIPYWGIITQHNALSYLPEYSQYPLDTALSTYFPPDSTTRYHTFQVLPLNPIASVSDNSVAQCYNFDLSNTQHSIPPSPVSTGWGPDSTPTAFFSPSAPPTDTSVLALQSWPHHSSSGYPIDHSPYSDDADQGAARLQDLVASSPQTRGDGARAEKRRSRRARVSEEPSRPNSAGSNRSTAPNNTRRRRRRKPRRRNTSISNPNHPAPSLQLETIAYHAGGRSTLFASSPSSTASFSDGMTGAGNLDDLNQQRHQLQQALLFPQSSSSSDTSSSFTSFFPEAESGAPSRKASSSNTLPSPVETTPTPSTTAGSTARQIALPPSSSRIRARNRIAANKCRAKHKVVVTKLEERDYEVTRQRQELKREVTQLQDEVFSLKQKLFEHSDCNCVGIRGYLESMARQIVQRATQARGADGELTEQ